MNIAGRIPRHREWKSNAPGSSSAMQTRKTQRSVGSTYARAGFSE